MNIKIDKYLKDLVNRMHNGMNESLTGWKGAVKGFFILHQEWVRLLDMKRSKIWVSNKAEPKRPERMTLWTMKES